MFLFQCSDLLFPLNGKYEFLSSLQNWENVILYSICFSYRMTAIKQERQVLEKWFKIFKKCGLKCHYECGYCVPWKLRVGNKVTSILSFYCYLNKGCMNTILARTDYPIIILAFILLYRSLQILEIRVGGGGRYLLRQFTKHWGFPSYKLRYQKTERRN